MAKRLKVTVCVAITALMTFGACSGGYAKGDAYYGVGGGAPNYNYVGGNEEYTEIIENDFISTNEQNTSYFSIDANTASYPNLRSLINNNYEIPKDAVRVEEMLNYFDYDYQTPEGDEILALTSSVFDTPYNADTKLMTIGLAAQKVEFEQMQNNLVFLIDVSGSMYSEDKLPLVQQAFMLLAENLNPSDRVSIVTYAGADSVALDGAYGYEKKKIIAAISDLEAGGSTAGSKGINRAYQLAEKYFIEGENVNNRVILATDGDFNVGLSRTKDLEDFISEKRESGVYFSVFGVGRGNLKSEKMETLALNGNGTYAYIDSVREARRALVEQIGGTLVTVAKDVKAGVIFNPEYVESYRLIGYENKLLTEEEFNDETTDAGELGSGHTVTVAYEIKLRERDTAQVYTGEETLAQVTLKYKPISGVATNQETQKESLLDIQLKSYHEELTDTDLFVSSVIEFALLLRDSKYKGTANFNSLVERLNGLNLESDEFKAEFRDMVKQCRANLQKAA